jgi:hypothetical protein
MEQSTALEEERKGNLLHRGRSKNILRLKDPCKRNLRQLCACLLPTFLIIFFDGKHFLYSVATLEALECLSTSQQDPAAPPLHRYALHNNIFSEWMGAKLQTILVPLVAFLKRRFTTACHLNS